MRAEELLDAWDQGLDPLKDQPVLGAPKTAEDIVDDWDAESGGLLSGIKDMGVYALSAIPSAAQGIVDVGRMATGDLDILKNFSDWIGEQTDSFKDFALSDAALAQQRRLDRVMADPNYSIADLPAVIAENPRATLGSAVESAGSMLLPTGTGVAAARLAGQMGRLAQAGRGGALARVLGNVAPSKAAAAGTMVGNAALNAADALENQDQADRYLGALVSAGTSMLGSKVTGGGAENILAQLFTGNAARQIGKNAATRALVGMVKGGGKEFVQEGIEETGNIAGEVVGSGQPIDWNQGAKRVGLASTLGAIMGGPIGATSSIAARPQTIQQEEAAIPQDTEVQAAVEGALEAIGDLASTQTPQAAPQASRQEVKPQETPLPQVQPRGQNTEQVQPQARQTQPTPVDNAEVVAQQSTVQPTAQSTSQAPVILQNRDRSNKASIEQMDRIAGNPDYGRVGIGRDFANGAPVVAYGSVPENQKGRVDYATASTGERIPIQYAVVEADTVSTSHDITGNKNPNYGRTDLVTAIAGNGRVTGIAAAYRKGTAAKYRQELAEDSAMHGVNPEVINGMRNPVLVRIMPNERVTGNIGDLSNTTGNNQLNAVEKAHTDANRVNFEGMEFNEDGSPTQDSIVGFIRSMPPGERAELIDEHGRPNSQAIDRLNNAIFAKAYGNDDVIAMYAMAVDPEAKLVINTLSAVAPKMARLEGCGELDFRGVLIQAVNQIVEGKRKGLKMQDIVKQVDAFTDPDISLFLDLFAQNPRSNKQVIEVLSDAADFAYNEATRDTETEDMFGGVQQATRADLMQHIQQTNNQITELRNAQRQAKRSQAANIQNSAGSVRSGQNAPGGNTGTNPSQNEPRGSSDAQGNEGFSLTGQTESEIEAEALAREEAEAQRAREEFQDQQRQEAQNLRNEVSSLNEDYADNFTLTDDNTSAEDALRGQGDLRFSRSGVVQASESEISAAKENRKAFRDEIKKKIDSLYPDGTVITVQVESDGAAVFVSKATAKHSLGFRASWRSMLATLKLPELMRTANRVGDFEENPHKNHELVKGAYHYQSKINIDGTEYPVNITVRLHPEGLRMYHAKVDDKKPDAISGAMHNVQSTPPTSGSSDDILSEDGNGSNEPGLKFSRNPETNKPDIKFSVAWHGSPYVFDTFASEHIGSGTGRATYGWGLYFTADRQVAEKYRDSTNPDGSLFRVEIPDEDVLLDSDATFAEQPKKVRDAINKLYDEEYDDVLPDWWDGRQVYQDIILREEGYTDPDEIPGDYEMDMDNGELAGNARLASEKLNSIGVKGVKFIGDDEDTSYVIFDDKAIKVLDRFTRFNNSNQINPETNKPDLKLSVAWHGSPHVFETFASDHIGSGEGAQAHGWGLYFAQEREVAEGYRERLANDSWWSEWSVNGHQFGQNEDEDFKFLDSYYYGSENVLLDLLHHISLHKNRKLATTKQLQQAFDRVYKEAVESEFINESDRNEYFNGLEKLRSELGSLKIYRTNRSGRVFEVEIPDPIVMLDEDKLIKDQTYIKHLLERKAQNGGDWDFTADELPDWATGRDLYEFMSEILGSPKEASLYLNDAGIKGITYNGRYDGRCYIVFDDNAIQVLNYYSKIQGEQQGSTVESITETLSNDSDIGEAFRNLRSRGSVVVIQSESELPGFSMASRSPMKSVDANIRRGKEAMAKALSEKTTVHRAMFRTGMGWVDFVWGDVGGDVKSNGQRSGEKGIAHIIEARQRKDGLTEKQTVALLDRIVETIARGSEVKRREFNGHQRVDLGYNGVLATLVKNPGSNAWLLTGFEIRESDDNRVGKDSPTSTSDAPHTPGAGEVADSLPPRTGNERHALATETVGLGERPSMDVTSSVGSEDLIVKRSADGSIQGAYDPRTQKVYLVADNLTDENARAVFMHEVGVHMAADGDMKAVFARAKQIVWNGAANGDKVAQAAKRRMDAAGETSPEEAAAYLVEEAVKAQKDLPKSHPIVQWLEDLMRRVRLWINKKLGVNNLPGLRLTTDDIVAVARANAKSLGNVERKPSNGMTTFAEDYKGEWRERRGNLHTKKGGPNIWSRNLGIHSGWGKLLERDERGDWKSGWGEHLVTGAGNFVLEAAEYFIPALRTKYALRMAPKEVREMYRELRAQVDNARRKAGKVAQEMAKWSDNDRRLISDVIEKALDADAHPPEHVLKMASMMSDLMTKQGEDLVALGMLSEESFNRWRGQYLPRFYNRRKELEGEGWFKNFMKRGAPLRGVGGGSLKGRGKYELIGVKDLDKYIRDGWEVRDERYTFNKEAKESQPELTFKDMPEVEVDEHQTVNVWRDWTPKERQEMGEIRDAGYRFVMGYMQMQEDLALGRLFKQIAENPAWTRNTPSEGYSAVPDTVIPETGGVKRYGSLAGKYVKDEVLAQVMPHAEVPSAFARAYRNLLAYWKEGKTALNPVSHMNNTAGNIIMAHLAGVDMWNAKAYWDIAQAFRHNAGWLKEAEENGLFSGSFSKEEIAKLLPEEFTRLEEQQESMVKRGFEFVFNYLLNYGLRQKMRNLYEAEDSFFKALIYKYAKDRGMSTKDAIDYALGFIPTYDDLPGGARFIRDNAIPFFAWTYKIVPRIAVSMFAYPHRFIAPAALLWTANMLSYAIAAGDDDDDWWTRFEKGQKLRESEEGLLPEYMQGMGAMFNPKFLRLWNDPTTNLPVYWNIGNFIPGGQMFDLTNQAGGIPRPEMLTMGSPLYTLWAAMGLNVDTFTGRGITKDSDTAGEATEKRATYLWRQLAPALAYGGYHFERVLNGLANATGEPIMGYTGIGRNGEAVTPLNAAINTMGLKVRNVDFQKEFSFKISDIQRENREILANIRSLSRYIKQGSINPLEGREEIKEQQEKIKDNAAQAKELMRLNRDRKKLSKGE